MTISNADPFVYLPPLAVIENLKTMLHIMQIMAYVITYVKFCLLLYYPVVNVAPRAMPIRNMYHDVDLVRMVVLTLNLILWLNGVVFCKIHN